MWQGGYDYSDHGEGISVSLYIPKGKRRKGKVRQQRMKNGRLSTNGTATESYLGGEPEFFDGDNATMFGLKGESIGDQSKVSNNEILQCDVCDHPLWLMCQVHAPLDHLDRTLYVFGCPRSGSCGNLPGTTIRCFRSQQVHSETVKNPNNPSTSAEDGVDCNDVDTNPWDSDDYSDGGWGNQESDENDWGMEDAQAEKEIDAISGCSDGENDDDWGLDEPCNLVASNEKNAGNVQDDKLLELESMLAAVEMKGKECAADTEKASQPGVDHDTTTRESKRSFVADETSADKNWSSNDNHDCCCFPRVDLQWIDEPLGSVDPNDFSNDKKTDDRIEKLLTNYYKSEDDEQLVETLRGLASTTSLEGRIKVAKDLVEDDDERLGQNKEVEDDVFIAFSKRVQREPQQLIRYAYGGEAMWSSDKMVREAKKFLENKSLMTCPCGEVRVFEFQLMPSVLHQLQVERFDDLKGGNRNMDTDKFSDASDEQCRDVPISSAMDWDVVALYSCPKSCEKSREEIVLVEVVSTKALVGQCKE